MTPDDLRALDDAIVYRDSLAIARAADYLRDCADAQPVAKIERVATGAIALFAPGGGPFDMSQHVGASLYTRPAPAAPQEK